MDDSDHTDQVLDITILTSSITDEDMAKYRKAHPAKKITISPILKWMVIILGGVMVIGLLAILVFAGGALAFSNVILTVVVIVGVVLAVRWMNNATLKELERAIRMTRFAEANEMTYTESIPFMKGPGMYFSVGIERTGTDVFSGTRNGWPFEFGNYTYGTGMGARSTSDDIGYIKIGLDRTLPQIVLDGQTNNTRLLGHGVSNLPVSYKANQKLDLEGDFNQYFQLYVPQGYERDALYIFTPDLMALFIDGLDMCDAEIVDTWLYVYHAPFNMDDPADYEGIMAVIDIVGAKLTYRTERYQDDRVDTTGGDRLRRGL